MESVAIYLRMSSDAQDLSLAQQEQELLSLCKRKGYRVASTYRDAGISGDEFLKRKGLRQMLAEASSGLFSRVLAWDQDRIGRFDSLTSGKVLAPLRDAGIVIETIAQGEIDLETFAGRVTYAVVQEGKHQFLKDMSKAIVRGQFSKAEEGNGVPGGPLLFGYDRVTDVAGRHRVSRLVVNEERAALVRRAFSMYLQPGMSFSRIAEAFNAEAIPSPNGKPYWEGDTIRYWLKNAAYTGKLVYGRRQTGKHSRRTRDGIVQVRPGKAPPASDPVVLDRPDLVPPLVSQATFDRVQTLIAERKTATRRHGATHALSGVIVCDRCGRKLHRDGGRWLCSSSKQTNKPNRCSGKRLREDMLRQLMDDTIQQHLLSDSGVALLEQRLEKAIARLDRQQKDDRPAMRKRLASLEKQLADGAMRLLKVPAGLIPSLSEALDAVRAERDRLAEALAQQDREPAAPSPTARLREIVAQAGKALPKASRYPEAYNAMLRQMGAEIRVLQNDSEAIRLEARLLPVGEFRRSSGCASEPTGYLILEIFKAPPGAEPGFRPGNKLGRGLPPEKARAAARARWG